MAARRSSRPSTGARSRRPSARSAQANNTTGIIIGVGVVVIVVAVAAMTMGGGDKGDKAAKPPAVNAATKDPAPVAAKPLPVAREGKEPTRAAPNLSAEALTKADAYYLKAKKMHDDGRRAQSAGDNKEFNKLMNDSWDVLESLNAHIEPYTEWLEEADLEGWRLPGAYVKLQKRLNVYDKLSGGLRRVKGNRQK